MAFFAHPEAAATLEPIPSPLLEGVQMNDDVKDKTRVEQEFGFAGGRKESMTAGEHLMLRLKRSYLY